LKSKLLIEDRPLIVLPVLAKEVGLEEAIIMQQLHFLLRDPRNGKLIGKRRWIYNTYEGWAEHFIWLKPHTIKRYFLKLEKWGVIESCQPEGRRSRRKYYRLKFGDTA